MAMSPEEKRRKICERAQKWWLLNKERANENKRQWRARKRLGLQEKRKRVSPEERRQRACERTREWLRLNKERARETKKQSKLLHPEEHKQKKKESYLRYRDETLKRRKEAYQLNPEPIRQKTRQWHAANKHLRQTEEARKRACEISKRYAERHPDKRREYEKANTQKRREQLREWRVRNPDKYKAQLERNKPSPEINRKRAKEYYDRHPERGPQRQRARRAAKLKAGGSFTPEDVARLYALQDGKCVGCGVKFKTTGTHRYHVDHIIPLKPRDGSKPGSNGPENLQLLCRPCNCQKGNRSQEEWMRRRKSG